MLDVTRPLLDRAGLLVGQLRRLRAGAGVDPEDDRIMQALIRNHRDDGDVLARIGKIITRELGSDWRRTVRPFGPLTGWGETAGQPITLADAVEYLAADRAQWKHQAEESRTGAAKSAEGMLRPRVDADKHRGQLREVRVILDRVLRPNATALADCEWCGSTPCDYHADRDEGEAPEPPLSDDLAVEVGRLITRMYEAQSRERSARSGRVTVYVDGHRVTGPDVFKIDGLEGDHEGGTVDDPAEYVHRRHDGPAETGPDMTLCGEPVETHRSTFYSREVTCPRCLRELNRGIMP